MGRDDRNGPGNRRRRCSHGYRGSRCGLRLIRLVGRHWWRSHGALGGRCIRRRHSRQRFGQRRLGWRPSCHQHADHRRRRSRRFDSAQAGHRSGQQRSMDRHDPGEPQPIPTHRQSVCLRHAAARRHHQRPAPVVASSITDFLARVAHHSATALITIAAACAVSVCSVG